MEGQGTAVEGQGTAVEGQGNAVEGQGTAVDGQGKAVDKQWKFKAKAVRRQRKVEERQGRKAVEGSGRARNGCVAHLPERLGADDAAHFDGQAKPPALRASRVGQHLTTVRGD